MCKNSYFKQFCKAKKAQKNIFLLSKVGLFLDSNKKLINN